MDKSTQNTKTQEDKSAHPLFTRLNGIMSHSAMRFALVGVVNTALDFIVFCTLYYAVLPSYFTDTAALLIANTAGFCLAVINSYLMNKAWTFKDESKGREAWQRGGLYVLVALGGLGVSSLVIWLAALAMPAFIAKILATGASFVWNYFISKRIVFKA